MSATEEKNMTFTDKLKSWKRWGAIIGALLPIFTQAVTGEVTWEVAIGLAVMSIMVGLGVVGWEDVNRLKASASAHHSKAMVDAEKVKLNQDPQ